MNISPQQQVQHQEENKEPQSQSKFSNLFLYISGDHSLRLNINALGHPNPPENKGKVPVQNNTGKEKGQEEAVKPKVETPDQEKK